MNIFDKCEQMAIEHYAQYGIDISTKEKRIAMQEEDKKEIFNFLIKCYFNLKFRNF